VFQALPRAELVSLAWAFAHPIRVVADHAKSDKVAHHVIVTTESRVTKSRVEAVLTDYEPIRDGTWMTKIRTTAERVAEHWLHVVDGVKSAPQLRDKLRAVLDGI
jgi:hypothetical protein